MYTFMLVLESLCGCSKPAVASGKFSFFSDSCFCPFSMWDGNPKWLSCFFQQLASYWRHVCSHHDQHELVFGSIHSKLIYCSCTVLLLTRCWGCFQTTEVFTVGQSHPLPPRAVASSPQRILDAQVRQWHLKQSTPNHTWAIPGPIWVTCLPPDPYESYYGFVEHWDPGNILIIVCRFALQSRFCLYDFVESNCDPCLCNKRMWSSCDRYVDEFSTTLWTYPTW